MDLKRVQTNDINFKQKKSLLIKCKKCNKEFITKKFIGHLTKDLCYKKEKENNGFKSVWMIYANDIKTFYKRSLDDRLDDLNI